ncbi:hypothetical protein ACGC1H_007347 [Rhizoctonia solani]
MQCVSEIKRKAKTRSLTKEVNVKINLHVEVEQGLVTLIAHVAASDEHVARLTGSSDRKGSGSRSRSSAGEHAEREHEQCKRDEARESRVELHGGESESGRVERDARAVDRRPVLSRLGRLKGCLYMSCTRCMRTVGVYVLHPLYAHSRSYGESPGSLSLVPTCTRLLEVSCL